MKQAQRQGIVDRYRYVSNTMPTGLSGLGRKTAGNDRSRFRMACEKMTATTISESKLIPTKMRQLKRGQVERCSLNITPMNAPQIDRS